MHVHAAVLSLLVLVACSDTTRVVWIGTPGLEPGHTEVLLVRRGTSVEVRAYEAPISRVDLAVLAEEDAAPALEAFVYPAGLDVLGLRSGINTIAPEDEGGRRLPTPSGAFRARFEGQDFVDWQTVAIETTDLDRTLIAGAP